MSKTDMPRPRYVAFAIEGDAVGRKAFGAALRSRARRDGWAEPDAPQLTRYAWPHGIARVTHGHVGRLRELLPRIDGATEGDRRVALRVRTLGTSGTLDALTSRLGVLRDRGEQA